MVGLRLLCCATLITATAAAAADVSKLPGMSAYLNGDFGTAARELQKALPTLAGEDRMNALMYLAAASFAKSRAHDTNDALEQLFREFPTATMDPNVFDPDLIALSKKVEANERGKRVKLTPPEKSAPPEPVVVEQSRGRGPGPYLATGGAAVALGASVFFVTSANRQKGALDGSFDSGGRSTLTFPEAQLLREGANRDMTLALAAGVATAALTGVAIWLWTRSDP